MENCSERRDVVASSGEMKQLMKAGFSVELSAEKCDGVQTNSESEVAMSSCFPARMNARDCEIEADGKEEVANETRSPSEMSAVECEVVADNQEISTIMLAFSIGVCDEECSISEADGKHKLTAIRFTSGVHAEGRDIEGEGKCKVVDEAGFESGISTKDREIEAGINDKLDLTAGSAAQNPTVKRSISEADGNCKELIAVETDFPKGICTEDYGITDVDDMGKLAATTIYSAGSSAVDCEMEACGNEKVADTSFALRIHAEISETDVDGTVIEARMAGLTATNSAIECSVIDGIDKGETGPVAEVESSAGIRTADCEIKADSKHNRVDAISFPSRSRAEGSEIEADGKEVTTMTADLSAEKCTERRCFTEKHSRYEVDSEVSFREGISVGAHQVEADRSVEVAEESRFSSRWPAGECEVEANGRDMPAVVSVVSAGSRAEKYVVVEGKVTVETSFSVGICAEEFDVIEACGKDDVAMPVFPLGVHIESVKIEARDRDTVADETGFRAGARSEECEVEVNANDETVLTVSSPAEDLTIDFSVSDVDIKGKIGTAAEVDFSVGFQAENNEIAAISNDEVANDTSFSPIFRTEDADIMDMQSLLSALISAGNCEEKGDVLNEDIEVVDVNNERELAVEAGVLVGNCATQCGIIEVNGRDDITAIDFPLGAHAKICELDVDVEDQVANGASIPSIICAKDGELKVNGESESAMTVSFSAEDGVEECITVECVDKEEIAKEARVLAGIHGNNCRIEADINNEEASGGNSSVALKMVTVESHNEDHEYEGSKNSNCFTEVHTKKEIAVPAEIYTDTGSALETRENCTYIPFINGLSSEHDVGNVSFEREYWENSGRLTGKNRSEESAAATESGKIVQNSLPDLSPKKMKMLSSLGLRSKLDSMDTFDTSCDIPVNVVSYADIKHKVGIIRQLGASDREKAIDIIMNVLAVHLKSTASNEQHDTVSCDGSFNSEEKSNFESDGVEGSEHSAACQKEYITEINVEGAYVKHVALPGENDDNDVNTGEYESCNGDRNFNNDTCSDEDSGQSDVNEDTDHYAEREEFHYEEHLEKAARIKMTRLAAMKLKVVMITYALRMNQTNVNMQNAVHQVWKVAVMFAKTTLKRANRH